MGHLSSVGVLRLALGSQCLPRASLRMTLIRNFENILWIFGCVSFRSAESSGVKQGCPAGAVEWRGRALLKASRAALRAGEPRRSAVCKADLLEPTAANHRDPCAAPSGPSEGGRAST